MLVALKKARGLYRSRFQDSDRTRFHLDTQGLQ